MYQKWQISSRIIEGISYYKKIWVVPTDRVNSYLFVFSDILLCQSVFQTRARSAGLIIPFLLRLFDYIILKSLHNRRMINIL